MKTSVRALIALAALVCAPAANATLFTFEATDLGQNTWRYDYSITNDTLADPLTYFVIDFDLGAYTNLRDAAGPLGWDILLLQPDPQIPAGGVFDALALEGGIELGATLGGFSLIFDFLGTGTPGAQLFSVLNLDFEIIDNGSVVDAASVSVPEPGTLALLGAGLLLTTLRRRRLT